MSDRLRYSCVATAACLFFTATGSSQENAAPAAGEKAEFDPAHVLQHTDAKVVDIALDLGYSGQAHFSRAFRRWMGLAPGEYRRSMRTTHTPQAGVET